MANKDRWALNPYRQGVLSVRCRHFSHQLVITGLKHNTAELLSCIKAWLWGEGKYVKSPDRCVPKLAEYCDGGRLKLLPEDEF